VVFKYNGMLDKYTGDGIMAIFGAPVEKPDHALDACHAILAFEALARIEITAGVHQIPLITRVGAHSGPMVVGNIGSPDRTDFTAIGDTVNTSARLEGINKIYGTLNTISETTYEPVKDKIICREMDFIRVKGRNKPLRIYNVICRKEDFDKNTELFLSIHNEALELYRTGDFKKSGKVFEKLLLEYPGDPVALTYVERCQALRKDRNLIDKDGIFNVRVKLWDDYEKNDTVNRFPGCADYTGNSSATPADCPGQYTFPGRAGQLFSADRRSCQRHQCFCRQRRRWLAAGELRKPAGLDQPECCW